MLKGFKDFLLKGNVLDLAVAVVVGAAFTAIVTAFTEHIVQPLIASIGGGKDVQRVVDVPGVPARPAWTEQLPIQRYIRYTAEELAAQEEARKKAEAREKLPDTVAALQTENEMLKQCLLEMSEIVYA